MRLHLTLAAVLLSGSALAQTRPTIPHTSYPPGSPTPVIGEKDLLDTFQLYAATNGGTLTNPTVTGGTAAGTEVSQTVVGGATVAAALAAKADTSVVGVAAGKFKLTSDGVDDAPSIQRAINSICTSGALGGVVQLPSGPVYWNSAVTNNACPIRIQGAGAAEVPSQGGTWITVGGTTYTPFLISGTAARGTEVRDLGVTQAQPTPAAGWTPRVYPPVFSVQNTAGTVAFRNIRVAPVYDLITASGAGRLELEGVWGQPIHAGITLDASFDAVHAGVLHFWPLWSADGNVLAWQQQNGDTIVLGGVDGLRVADLFTYGYRSALSFPALSSRRSTKISIGRLYADFTKWPLWVQTGAGDGGLFTTVRVDTFEADGERGDSPGTPITSSAAIRVENGAKADIRIGQFSAERFESNALQLLDTGTNQTTVTIGAATFSNLNTLNNSAPILNIASTTGNPHRVDFATQPIVRDSFSPPLFGPTNAVVRVPLPMPVIRPVTNNGTYGTGNSEPIVVFSGASGTQDNATVYMPVNPSDGYVQTFSTIASLTNLHVMGNTGQTMSNTPTALNAFTKIQFQWSAALATWLRLQ